MPCVYVHVCCFMNLAVVCETFWEYIWISEDCFNDLSQRYVLITDVRGTHLFQQNWLWLTLITKIQKYNNYRRQLPPYKNSALSPPLSLSGSADYRATSPFPDSCLILIFHWTSHQTVSTSWHSSNHTFWFKTKQKKNPYGYKHGTPPTCRHACVRVD